MRLWLSSAAGGAAGHRRRGTLHCSMDVAGTYERAAQSFPLTVSEWRLRAQCRPAFDASSFRAGQEGGAGYEEKETWLLVVGGLHFLVDQLLVFVFYFERLQSTLSHA